MKAEATKPKTPFGAAVAALIPARTGASTPGAASIDRMRAWAATQDTDYAAAMGTADRGVLLRIGHALVARGLLLAGTVPTFGSVEDARDDAWSAGWDSAPRDASRAQRACAAKRAQARHDDEVLALLRRDLAPAVASALSQWAAAV